MSFHVLFVLQKTVVGRDADPESSRMFDGSMAGPLRTSGRGGESTQGNPGVMSSQDLLIRMRTRNYGLRQGGSDDPEASYMESGAPEAASVCSTTMDISAQDLELFTDIRNHVAFGSSVDGQSTTQELLDHFQDKLPVSDTAKFKAMLSQICDFYKESGIGTWRLKAEFR